VPACSDSPPASSGEPAPTGEPASSGQVTAGRRPGWWIGPLYLVLAVALIPWTGFLAATLPQRATSHHYDLAWVGFDLLLAASLARTAWLSLRRSPFVVNVASASATLLVVDAWFDVTTSPLRDVPEALVSAMLVELPLAALSLFIATRAQREIARTGAVRQHRRRGRISPATGLIRNSDTHSG